MRGTMEDKADNLTSRSATLTNLQIGQKENFNLLFCLKKENNTQFVQEEDISTTSSN